MAMLTTYRVGNTGNFAEWNSLFWVLGASTTEWRYGHIAGKRLINSGYPTTLVGKRGGEIKDVPILPDLSENIQVDTVTMYLNPSHQDQYAERILAMKPKRVIFNPGAENPDFAERLKDSGVEVVEACTLVMLSTGQF